MLDFDLTPVLNFFAKSIEKGQLSKLNLFKIMWLTDTHYILSIYIYKRDHFAIYRLKSQFEFSDYGNL